MLPPHDITTSKAQILDGSGAPLPGIVGIGASAGGLDACIRLLEMVPEKSGLAFVLIVHLSPDHKSLMAELLGARTTMTVRQATHGQRLEPNSLSINPPGHDVTLQGGVLCLTKTAHRPGARMGFDTFLHSLAIEAGPQALCVVLSGAGSDGADGLRAIKRSGGMVIVQDPDEASSDGMPLSAIMTGDVDLVLKAAEIPAALIRRRETRSAGAPDAVVPTTELTNEWGERILVALLERTGSDFKNYKPGTLRRRIARRMSMRGIAPADAAKYLAALQTDHTECAALVADLLINVTRFFRDKDVFDRLEGVILPEMIKRHDPTRPLRVWVAGCSSGEEAWSLAMILRELLEADGRSIILQLLASDRDPDAVATARQGLYPGTISVDVPPARLARHFAPEGKSFRIRKELSAGVVFSVQDLLADPPFAKLDLISCRNVLIYLDEAAQAKVLSLFRFALRVTGTLVLGASETIDANANGFREIEESARIFRRVDPFPAAKEISLATPTDTAKTARPDVEPPVSTLAAGAHGDICRRAVAETFAPASVLVNRSGACLHLIGPTENFLRNSAGDPTQDITSMVGFADRAALRAAIQEVDARTPLKVLRGASLSSGANGAGFRIEVRLLTHVVDDLILVSFIESAASSQTVPHIGSPAAAAFDTPDAAGFREIEGLKAELAYNRQLLAGALQAHRTAHEESLAISEEYQATNEELVTSKEELQSLNEELTVLNSQLNNSNAAQRALFEDLQNVLYSTDVATLFLDTNLNIRFFTPATKAIFGVISSDISRPLVDLRPLTTDSALIADAGKVLLSGDTIGRDIRSAAGRWYLRTVLPYRTHDGKIGGVVITYVDDSDRHAAALALSKAMQEVEMSSQAKTRFLATASHDLRQPLQTLSFIHSRLKNLVGQSDGESLVARMEQTITVMTGMLNALLDINLIEAGIVSADITEVRLKAILDTLRAEYEYHAFAKDLKLTIIPCRLVVMSDPRLLEQILRNLLSNALKYTHRGRVIVGCRRMGRSVRIEVWDTGIGISDNDLKLVFEEYHQVGRAKRGDGDGLGLGLAIVRRLARLLNHAVQVQSRVGFGSVFSITVPFIQLVPRTEAPRSATPMQRVSGPDLAEKVHVLVVEDDPDLLVMLTDFLNEEGHDVLPAADYRTASMLFANASATPTLLLADYNLPDGRTGLELARELQSSVGGALSVIILTGNISAATMREIAMQGYVQLNKPTTPPDILRAIDRVMFERRDARPAVLASVPARVAELGVGVIAIVDDDRHFREGMTDRLTHSGRRVVAFESGEAFLAALQEMNSGDGPACALIDGYLTGISGLELLTRLCQTYPSIGAIMITGHSDVAMAVSAMRSGALDFIEKPVDWDALDRSIERAIEFGRDAAAREGLILDAVGRLATLTPREREIMNLVLDGHLNKNIAADLGISQRTVENHRASVMVKTGVASLPELARLAVVAAKAADRKV